MNLYLTKLFCKPGQNEGSQLLYVGTGKWGDGITPFSFHMSIYIFHSTIQRKEYYFPFLKTSEKRAKLLKVKSLRRMGKVEQERLYSVPFINIYQGFLSKAQAPSQEP